MGILDIFRKARQSLKFSHYKQLGEYEATFSGFGGNIYKSELVRSCIRPLAEFTGKANAKSPNKQLERLLNERPNQYMTGRDFLYKVRTMTELRNTCFIYISRNDRGQVESVYPVPYASFEALEYANGLFIRFYFDGDAARQLVLPWEDLAVMRKDYYMSDIAGEDNRAILNTLGLIQTTNQGLSNAIRATANLRGILKSTKAMLAPDAIKAQKDQFVQDYLSLENAGGIASLDATQEFTPITMSPTVVSWEQMRELRENVYRYFGVNDDIVMSKMSSDQLESFYESKIEPFLVALSQELTSKIFNSRERAFGNWVVYEANKLQFVSLDKKIALWNSVVLYGGMTINEWREGCNMSPIEGGDELIRRLDADTVNAPSTGASDSDQEEESNEE